MIPVTIPFVPPLQEYAELLQGIWNRRILTHNGPLVQQLERDLCRYLGIEHLVALTNGTVAIQLAIRALKLRGEIITTPFTWIATASAVVWEGCTPVFVDVDSESFNIDPDQIEDCITNKTSAILGVHVFGRPCNIEAIDSIAKAHGLKVIYDAAHAMCVNYRGTSVLECGDISCTSFHATKLFNTAEGGACTSRDPDLTARLQRLRFFGHDDNKNIIDDGCNGKMTEVHAALGLANLKHLDHVRSERRRQYEQYQARLSRLPEITFQSYDPSSYNFSYLPLVFADEYLSNRVEECLNKEDIFPRRYFRPALNTLSKLFPYTPRPKAESLASRILCMPLYCGLPDEDLDRICRIVESVLKGRL